MTVTRGIVLGAGRSTRMGGRPKLLTPIQGAPAVARIVGALRDAGVDDITVVAPVGVELPELGARVVRNPDPDAGRTGSLQLGVSWANGPTGRGPTGTEKEEGRGDPFPSTSSVPVGPLARSPWAPSVVVWPVDHPLASAATVRALLATDGEWVLPTHLGRSGHPIVIRGARALDAIRRAAPATPLRAIPPQLGIVPVRVAVDDAGVLANLDTPADVARHAADPELRLVPWGPGDFALLERLLGDAAMMTHLGGPEPPEKLRDRQRRYELINDPMQGRSLKVALAATGEGVGWVGYWRSSWRGEDVFEMGWSVLPEWQGRGIATRATRMALDLAREASACRFVHAMPGIDNAASNAVCRKLGFELLGPCDVEFPPGHTMRANDWRYDLDPRQAI